MYPIMLLKADTIYPITGLMLALATVLAGCATTPPAIREVPPGDLQLREVRENISAHRGTRVRWGGVIVSVENKTDETWIQVLELKLSRSGQPKRQSPSDGRFLMRAKGFLDPAVYAKDVEITVVGTLGDEVERSIGEHPYSFPVVSADAYHLWRPARYYGHYPYRHYPSYYYGYYYYPYGYHHYAFHFGHRHHHHGLHFSHRHHRRGFRWVVK